MYRYRAFPFFASVKRRVPYPDRALEASKQLEEQINKLVLDGWEYVRVENVGVLSAPGCLTAFFGHEATYERMDMIVVRRLQE